MESESVVPAVGSTLASEHGWLSLLPPVVAIVLAIATRRVIASLLAGTFVGALILARGNPLRAVSTLAVDNFWPQVIDRDHLYVLAFTLLMGAMVGVLNRAGGMRGLVDAVSVWASNRRRGQLATWFVGLAMFFDDYANALLVGTTFRSLADRLRISREKLAYLVDSTSAPVAGLALVSTWVAGEISYIQQGLDALDADPALARSAFDVFVATLPYRFYAWWALLLVAVVAVTNRDWGPMLTAERRAQSQLGGAIETLADRLMIPAAARPYWNAVVPVMVRITVIVYVLYATGRTASGDLPGASWAETFGNGDSYVALTYGSIAGLATAVLLAAAQRFLQFGAMSAAILGGAWQMMPAMLVLWFAWTLSGLTDADHLGTGVYISGIVSERIALLWLPTLVFLLAGGVAFATGTSWGTMGMLTPLVIEVTASVLSAEGVAEDSVVVDPIFLATVGSVLAGAIFGDHCSPISDTTILSSRASGCDHVAHVRTQIPYALLGAAVSIAFGTLIVGAGFGVGMAWSLGVIVLVATHCGLGRKVDDQRVPPSDDA